MSSAHESFDGVDCVFGICDLLVSSDLADEAFAFVGEADDGWREP